jgi:hypothetical protein
MIKNMHHFHFLQGKRLKAIMLAAAELAALRLRDLPASDHQGGECKNQAFCLLDKNGDGRISIEELTEVMEDLGAEGEDAMALMHLLDANSDGSLSFDEFESFQRQVCASFTSVANYPSTVVFSKFSFRAHRFLIYELFLAY